VDEVQLFNTALSATQVQAIHSAGHAGECKGLTFSRASLDPPEEAPVTNKFALPITVTSIGSTGNFAETKVEANLFEVGEATREPAYTIDECRLGFLLVASVFR
jgi:hypothetical protein